MLPYIDTGKGNETIIFIHSYLWDKEMWRPQLDYFKEKYRCISIDLIGHGNGKIVDENLDFETIAKEITSIIDSLKIEKYTYVGLSVGGMLAPYIYDIDKEKIKKMVLMDTYLGSEPAETKNLYFNMLDGIEECQCFPKPLIERIAPIFFAPNISNTNLKLLEDFKSHLANIPQKNINTIVQLGRIIFGRKSRLPFISKVEIPLFFIAGEFDIPRPYSELEEMHKIATNSKIYKISNAGHISNLENSEEVNETLNYIFATEEK